MTMKAMLIVILVEIQLNIEFFVCFSELIYLDEFRCIFHPRSTPSFLASSSINNTDGFYFFCVMLPFFKNYFLSNFLSHLLYFLSYLCFFYSFFSFRFFFPLLFSFYISFVVHNSCELYKRCDYWSGDVFLIFDIKKVSRITNVYSVSWVHTSVT